MNVRFPYHAGSFYAGTKEKLKKQIKECFLYGFGPGALPTVNAVYHQRIQAVICPHAGYVYSGAVAANGYYELFRGEKPESIIIIGPNHTGFGSDVSIMTDGMWRTPLGDVRIDTELAKTIQNSSNTININDHAHVYEHSIEVQLPFLQYLYGDKFKFVPICMMNQDLGTSYDVGNSIVEAISGKNVVIIASTDFSHYESQETAKRKDQIAIEAVLKLDEAKLQNVVKSYDMSMCGYGPVSATIFAAKKIDVKNSKLLCYATSGDITDDLSQVVGYASLVMF